MGYIWVSWGTHIICKGIFSIINYIQVKTLIIAFITQTKLYKNLLGYWGYIEKSDSKPGWEGHIVLPKEGKILKVSETLVCPPPTTTTPRVRVNCSLKPFCLVVFLASVFRSKMKAWLLSLHCQLVEKGTLPCLSLFPVPWPSHPSPPSAPQSFAAYYVSAHKISITLNWMPFHWVALGAFAALIWKYKNRIFELKCVPPQHEYYALFQVHHSLNHC